jgi:hypothetical protein
MVLGPDWPDPDLTLGGPWFRKSSATLDICDSKLLLNDNFAIPFKEVDYILTLSDSQIWAITDFSN